MLIFVSHLLNGLFRVILWVVLETQLGAALYAGSLDHATTSAAST